MQLMVEKGDAVYDELNVEEALLIFKEHTEGWLAVRKKLYLIKDETINSCTDEYLGADDLISNRDEIKNVAKMAQEICQSRYGCYYE